VKWGEASEYPEEGIVELSSLGRQTRAGLLLRGLSPLRKVTKTVLKRYYIWLAPNRRRGKSGTSQRFGNPASAFSKKPERKRSVMKSLGEFVVFVVSTSVTLALIFWLVSVYLDPQVAVWIGLD
jgi:hypothetical protein